MFQERGEETARDCVADPYILNPGVAVRWRKAPTEHEVREVISRSIESDEFNNR